MIKSTPNQLASFINKNDGVASIVTKVSRGYAVTLIDTDAELTVPVAKIFPAHMMAQAINYAKSLIKEV